MNEANGIRTTVEEIRARGLHKDIDDYLDGLLNIAGQLEATIDHYRDEGHELRTALGLVRAELEALMAETPA